MPPVEYVRFAIWLVLAWSMFHVIVRFYRRWRWYETFIHRASTTHTRREHVRHVRIVARFLVAAIATPINLFLLGAYSATVFWVFSS